MRDRVNQKGWQRVVPYVSIARACVTTNSDRVGDDAAFEAVIDRHARRLFGLALSILRDAGEAEEAVQETMTKAWRGWGGLRDAANEAAWLSRICVNHCLSRRRRLLRGRSAAEAHGTDTSAASDALRDTHDLDLDRAFRRLSVHQRGVVVLHYYHGYSLDECAQLMGCRPGTARTHLARALRRLRLEMIDA